METKSKYMLQIENLRKSYGNGEAKVEVLKSISAGIKRGKICTIYGPSGSGKSSLLNIIGGLDVVDSGKVYCADMEITNMNPKELELFRRKNLGFIFQMYNLLPDLTVRENIQVCEYLSEDPLDIDEIIKVLGLEQHKNKYPAQLSGGQQQRCAIGRALVKNPKLLLCDEPTGALDMKTSLDILMLLEQVNQKFGTTMIMVTHNTTIKEMSHQVITIKDGKIVKNIENSKPKKAAELEW